MRLRKTKKALITFTVLTAIFSVYIYLSLPDVTFLATSHPSTTKFIELRRHQTEKRGAPFQLKWSWKPLTEISPFLVQTIFHTEDPEFMTHKGFTLKKIIVAARLNSANHHYTYGGSTITQQVAKNLFLTPEKTLVRKGKEFLIALALERHLTKEQILEIYLNIIEWGPGIFGAEEGARYWYGCSAKDLTPKQAVSLALIVSDPLHRDPRNPNSYIRNFSNQFFLHLANKGLISHQTMVESLYIPEKK